MTQATLNRLSRLSQATGRALYVIRDRQGHLHADLSVMRARYGILVAFIWGADLEILP